MAAVGSYLDARSHGGAWLVRIEDLDPPRVHPGASDDILRTLDAFGLHWDETIVRQSERSGAYADALAGLDARGLLRTCTCSRSMLAALPENRSKSTGGAADDVFHPPDCLPAGTSSGHAIRFRVPAGPVNFEDRSLGRQSIDVAATAGDFVLRRRDGLYAYQLAVVVDDAAQGITDIVRGCDLLSSTARQVLIQRALGLPGLRYLHLPIAVDQNGLKLSKSGDAPAAGRLAPVAQLAAVLEFLGQSPPAGLEHGSLDEAWRWALAHWRVDGFAGRASRTVEMGERADLAG